MNVGGIFTYHVTVLYTMSGPRSLCCILDQIWVLLWPQYKNAISLSTWNYYGCLHLIGCIFVLIIVFYYSLKSHPLSCHLENDALDQNLGFYIYILLNERMLWMSFLFCYCCYIYVWVYAIIYLKNWFQTRNASLLFVSV